MNRYPLKYIAHVSRCLHLSFRSVITSIFTIFLLCSTVPEVKSQDFINGFYMFNPLAFNPAIAGVDDQIVVSGIVRKQWFGMNGAPSTQFLSTHLPVVSWFDRFDRPGRISYPTGLSSGLMFSNDVIGAHRFSRVSVPVAARIRLTRSGIRLSLGLRADGYQYLSTYSDLSASDPESYVDDANVYNFDFAAGMYCYHTNWFAGLSMVNIRGFSPETYELPLKPQYFLTGGYAYKLNKEILLRVTSLATLVEKSPLSITVTPAVIIQENIETGLSYRYDDMIGAFIAYNPYNTIKVGYWYEYAVGPKHSNVGSSHEIFFQVSFDRFKKRVVSPRYFW